MNAITDAPPGTVPEWAIRYSHYEGEWLVLGDVLAWQRTHTCCTAGRSAAYLVGRGSGFERCSAACAAIDFTWIDKATYDDVEWSGDELAEAHAAFERTEREWIEAKRTG